MSEARGAPSKKEKRESEMRPERPDKPARPPTRKETVVWWRLAGFPSTEQLRLREREKGDRDAREAREATDCDGVCSTSASISRSSGFSAIEVRIVSFTRSMNCLRSVVYMPAASALAGSFGLGSENSDMILIRIVSIPLAGDQYPVPSNVSSS